MIYPCFSRSVCFQRDCLLGEFGFWSSRSSLLSQWHDAHVAREFQMWRRRCKQIDPHWFQGRQVRFSWMWSTTSWKCFMIYPAWLFSAEILTRSLLHPIFNSLLNPATVCESQAKACDTEIIYIITNYLNFKFQHFAFVCVPRSPEFKKIIGAVMSATGEWGAGPMNSAVWVLILMHFYQWYQALKDLVPFHLP